MWIVKMLALPLLSLLAKIKCSKNAGLYLFAGLLNNKVQMNLAFNGHSEQNSSKYITLYI